MKQPLVALVAVLVIIVSGVSLYLSQRESSPQINLKPFEGIGLVGAEEVAKLLHRRGRVVVVRQDDKSPPMEAAVTAFTTELQKHSGLIVTAVKRIPVKLEEMPTPEGGMSEEVFLQLLQKHPDVDAIVSFLGVPYFSDENIRQLPARRPPFVSLSGFSPQIRYLLQAGIVNLAVVPQINPAAETAPEPQTPREWFDRYFMVATPANVDELPDF